MCMENWKKKLRYQNINTIKSKIESLVLEKNIIWEIISNIKLQIKLIIENTVLRDSI